MTRWPKLGARQMQQSTTKNCRQCGQEFTKQRGMQRVCTWQCGLALRKSEEEAKAKREATRRLRDGRKRLQTKSDAQKETQKAFNSYIRARDDVSNQPCIQCNKLEAEPMNGYMWDAGHFQGTGGYPELRFNELNCHREHSRCNRGAAKGNNDRTAKERYRANLVNRIGGDMVEWLEGPHQALRLDIEQLRALTEYYKKAEKEARR